MFERQKESGTPQGREAIERKLLNTVKDIFGYESFTFSQFEEIYARVFNHTRLRESEELNAHRALSSLTEGPITDFGNGEYAIHPPRKTLR